MDTEKQPTAGCEFTDFRYGKAGYTIVTVLDIPEKGIEFKQGDQVLVGGVNGKVYGPYQLEMRVAHGNGRADWKAYNVGAASKPKVMSKSELEAALTNTLAELETLKAVQRKAK